MPAMIGSHAEAVTIAHEYAESLVDGVIERDRSGTVPHQELTRLDASGLLAITVPRDHGGPDLSPVTLTEVIRAIATVDPAVAQAPQGHFMFVDLLAVWGSEDQQRKLFAEVLAGGRLGPALAERGAQHAQDLKTDCGGLGSPAASTTARARSHRADRGQRVGRTKQSGGGVRSPRRRRRPV
jgi:alkylation response protein AidB-like acyl-CoA dehydrogenase